MSDYKIDIDFDLNPEQVAADSSAIKNEMKGVGATSSEQAKRTADAIGIASKNFSDNVAAGKLFKQQLAEIDLQTKSLADDQEYLNTLYSLGMIDKKKFVSAQSEIAAKQKELRVESKLLNDELNKLSTNTLPKVTRSTGQLNNSINQITRELPAFTFSAQTGFLALSNNIPILVDEINRLRVSNQELIASGQKAPSLFSQLIKGVFSFQTALSLGVTLLTIYGKEIGNFITSLFKGNKAIDEAKLRIDNLNKALESSDFKKAIVGVEELRVNIDLAKKGILDKESVVKQYNDTIGKTTGRVKDLNAAEKELTKDADAYVKMMLYKAAANIALEEASKSAFEAEKSRLKKLDDFKNEFLDAQVGNIQSEEGYRAYEQRVKNNRERRKQEEIKASEDAKNAQLNIFKKFQTDAAQIAKDSGFDFFSQQDGKEEKEAEKQARLLAEALERRRDLLNKISDLNDEFSRKGLTKDEEELEALKSKFKKVRRIIDEFNADPKNSKVAKVDVSQIDPLEVQATKDLTYRQGTRNLLEELAVQKQLFSDYEAYRTSVSETEANNRYSKELKGYKTFADRLKAEIAKVVVGAGSVPLNGVEREKVASLAKLAQGANLMQGEADAKRFEEAFKAFKDYKNAEFNINLEFAKKQVELEKISDPTVKEAKLAELKRQQKEAIDVTRDEVYMRSSIYREFTQTLVGQSKREIEIRIATARKILESSSLDKDLRTKVEADLKNAEKALGGTVADTYNQQLKNRQQKLQEILQTQKLSTSEYEKTFDELTRTNAELEKIKGFLGVNGNLGAAIRASFGGGTEGGLEDVIPGSEKLKEGLQEASKAFGSIAQGTGELASAFEGVNDELAGTLQGISEVSGVISNVTGKLAEGDIFGAITSGIAGLVNIGKRVREMNAAARDQVEKFYDDAAKGEREYQALLRERERQQVRLNKLTLSGMQDQLKLLSGQSGSIQSEYQRLFAQLQGQQYLQSTSYTHGTWFRKAKTNETFGGLAGMDYDQIEQLYAQGKLTDGAKALFEQLRKLKEEGADVAKTLADLASEAKELWTGGTADDITNSIIEGFKNGYKTVQEFGDGFEEIMKKALLNSFKYQVLEKEIAGFYEEFAKQAENGLDAAKIADLEAKYNAIIGNASNRFQELEKVTGVSFAANGQSGNSGNLSGAIKGITADQADLLAGQFGGLRISVLQGNDIAQKVGAVISAQFAEIKNQSALLMLINLNTRNSADSLASIDASLKSMDKKIVPADPRNGGKIVI